MALQRPQPANKRIATGKIHTVRSQSPVSQLPNHRAHPPVFAAKQNRRQKRRHESFSILGESANLAIGRIIRSGELCDRAIDKFAVGKRHCRVLNALFSQNIPCRPYL